MLLLVKDPFVAPFVLISFKSYNMVGVYPILCDNNSGVSIKRFWIDMGNISHHKGLQCAISGEKTFCSE